jgi:predicted PurR-regulated permease PerM
MAVQPIPTSPTPPESPAPAARWRAASVNLLGLSLVILLLYYGRLFFITLVSSSIIAFLLEPMVEIFMRLKLPRAFAAFITCSLAVLVVYLAGLGLFTQMADLMDDLPNYTQRINKLLETANERVEDAEKSIYRVLPRRFQDAPPLPQTITPPERPTRKKKVEPVPPPAPTVPEVRVQQERTPLLVVLYDSIGKFYDPLLMVSFVPFLVYFMLSWADYFRRVYVSFFGGESHETAWNIWKGIAHLARVYMVGNFVLGLLVSFISTLFFLWIRLPYPLLIGPMSGFLSMVPYVGLPLALVPPFLSALTVYDGLPPYLMIAAVVGFLHLLALNLLYPKMVGRRVHLNPLAVTVALMFWGLLWGGIGLLLAIPITAGIKVACDNVESLRPYGRLLGD